jgi:hypothetical protein
LVGIPTNIIIDYKSDKKWDLVFDFFEERIKTRYINPINIILNMELKTGEGFAVVNLQCSLIETIECFINGWIYQKVEKKHVWYNNTSNEIINNNKDIYISFFSEREPFKSFIPKIDGANFYIDVRCALLHEAQTKNGWRILASGTSYPIEQKNIYRNDFQKAILRVIKDYKKAVVYCEKFGRIDGVDLRKNFIKKFNHICEVS